MVEAQNAKRLQLIMYIKNNMQLVGNENTILTIESTENFMQGEGHRKDGNLHFD